MCKEGYEMDMKVRKCIIIFVEEKEKNALESFIMFKVFLVCTTLWILLGFVGFILDRKEKNNSSKCQNLQED